MATVAAICRPALSRNSLISANIRKHAAVGIYNSFPLRQSQQPCLFFQERFRSVATDSTTPVASIPHTATTDNSTTRLPPPSPPSPPPPRSRTYRVLSATALIVLFGSLGFTMAAAPAATAINGTLSPPTDAETLLLYVPATPRAEEIDEQIRTSTVAQQMRARPEFVECRPHLKIPEAMRSHNLTSGTLMGDDKIAVPPLAFQDADSALPSLVSISYLGPMLCGHPGVIHGGLLATLLDEGLARACFPALPNKVGVTASLTINYKAPCPSDRFVVLRAETTKVDGRKAWVKGHIELLREDGEAGEVLVEAEALFIEPRGAKNMARIYSPSK